MFGAGYVSSKDGAIEPCVAAGSIPAFELIDPVTAPTPEPFSVVDIEFDAEEPVDCDLN